MAKREVTAWDNILSPAGFFSGLVLSFLSCCVAGFILRNQNCYEAVERFHRFINIETLFYPTACQLRALGRSRLDPEKIAVVVGGNSILYGTSQRDEAVWTRRLQELLGQQYQVINLGTPGALPGEFGGVAAEILARDYPRLIFFTDQQPAAPAGDPDGHLYRYLFWDAYYKGLLQSDSLREERLLQLGDSRTAREKLVELKLQMVQDSYLSFRDLWTTTAYRSVSTIWTAYVPKPCTKARRKHPDPEMRVSFPSEPSVLAARHDYAMWVVRHWIADRDTYLEPGRHPSPRRQTETQSTEEVSELEYTYKRAFPESCRRRTLVAVIHENPYYVNQLSAAERARYDALYPLSVQLLEKAGFTAAEIGADYSTSDFCDHWHITEEGGHKLAADVAPLVRALAERLGYTKEGSAP